ncbi:hypothetical protein VII00023_02869 [Vibrio ichthyoenteri ATCC 700023]|uniref:Uncharacterized protein n=1 Tax=Vibrio ichthyoenteri ATCC 700023 TaxID=870968 RepID=F9S0X5_9VIBR|nr:hypothetical protein VII00023_02869 [Vibrio ichthyoenteri ATCC 700023]
MLRVVAGEEQEFLELRIERREALVWNIELKVQV